MKMKIFDAINKKKKKPTATPKTPPEPKEGDKAVMEAVGNFKKLSKKKHI